MTRTLKNPAPFYDGVEHLTGSLTGTQVSVINNLLIEANQWTTAFLAYGLATAWHEARLAPIPEVGKGKGKSYGVPGHNNHQIAYGRGLVQTTWDVNYEKMDKLLGLNGALIKNYDLALDPKIAVDILIKGMSLGSFTGRKLGDYFPSELGTMAQFTKARAIINGTDCDALIGAYAVSFQKDLISGQWK